MWANGFTATAAGMLISQVALVPSITAEGPVRGMAKSAVVQSPLPAACDALQGDACTQQRVLPRSRAPGKGK